MLPGFFGEKKQLIKRLHNRGSSLSFWCIHGNLQRPSVWDQFDGVFFRSSSSSERYPLTLCKENLWELTEFSFESWLHAFLKRVSLFRSSEKPWIMGYSLGGRLALHAVLEKPDWWKGAIIIAAHPGISDPTEKSAQLIREKKWAERFLREPWNDLINEWDELSVFGGVESMIERNEEDYPREIVAKMLTGFSKAKQKNMMQLITGLKKPPILYVSGELDKKYGDLGAGLAAKSSNINHVVIPGACHRVPWENTTDFKESIQYFIDSIY